MLAVIVTWGRGRFLKATCCINILLMKNLMVTNNGSDKNVMDEEIGTSREHAGAVDTDVWQSNQPNPWQCLHPHQLQYHHGCSSSQLVRNLQEINKVIAGCRLGQFHYRHISNKDDLLIQRLSFPTVILFGRKPLCYPSICALILCKLPPKLTIV